MSSNLEEGITPAELGGMGPVQLPTDTQLGSGDIPSGIKSEEDDEDEKKKLKEMEGKQIHTSFNDFVSEATDVILEMDSEGIQSLADELSAEVYTARLKDGAKSATIKATTTTKTWDDGAPILKFLARGKAKSMPFALYQRPFTVLHDVAHGWFYFTDGRKWYGLHDDEGYSEPEDLPFNMEISESIVSERYAKSAGYKAAVDRIEGLSKQLDPMSRLCKGISKGADNVVPEFKEMEKHMEEIISIWNEIEMIIDMNESVVNENYEVIYSDGMSQMKKFRNERQALDFMNKEIASNKKLRDIAVYKPGMHSTTQTELVVKFWGEGSYLDNVSKRDKDLAAKKLEESVVTEAKFVKDFNRDVLNAKTKEEVLELYPNAEFFIGKSDHFFGELDGNLFFKAYYTKAQKEFEIKSVYSQKGSNYVHLYNESVVTEARSINKIQKEYSKVINDMTNKVASWKDCKSSGDTKGEANCLADLKELTAKKKALMSELDDAVGIKDLNIELAD